MLSTAQKILIAKLLSVVIIYTRKIFGNSSHAIVSRDGIKWNLDLNEGIDLSIFILGGFEISTINFYKKNIPEGSIILDIGANIGAHTLPFALLAGDNGKVYSFEPTGYAFKNN